jgi:hypothetical protein
MVSTSVTLVMAIVLAAATPVVNWRVLLILLEPVKVMVPLVFATARVPGPLTVAPKDEEKVSTVWLKPFRFRVEPPCMMSAAVLMI